MGMADEEKKTREKEKGEEGGWTLNVEMRI